MRFKKANFWWKWRSTYSQFTAKNWQWESTSTGSYSHLIRPEVKKNWNRKSKIVFLESLLKTVSRVLFSFFDIPSLDGGKGRWSLISGDDVITGSGPNQKNFIDFRGFRTYWIQFWNLYWKVHLPSLRSASVLTLGHSLFWKNWKYGHSLRIWPFVRPESGEIFSVCCWKYQHT